MERDTREKRGRLSEKDRFNQMMSPNLESKGGWGGGGGVIGRFVKGGF